jgi:hypothetical protein
MVITWPQICKGIGERHWEVTPGPFGVNRERLKVVDEYLEVHHNNTETLSWAQIDEELKSKKFSNFYKASFKRRREEVMKQHGIEDL